jgi:hypothetical protein
MTFVTAEHARTLSRPQKFGSPVFFTAGRVGTLREMLGLPDARGMVATSDARVNYEWNMRVMAHPLDYEPLGPLDPWHIDEHYDPEGSSNAEQLAIVNGDGEAAVDLAVRWLVLDDEAAGAAAIRILEAWSTIGSFDTNAGSALNWENKWPMFLQAASMMRDHEAYTPTLHAALQTVTSLGLELSGAYTNDNNWAAWGVVLEIASAGILEDRARMDMACRRWRTLFDLAVVDNIPVDEIYREGGDQGDGSSGLWYSNFLVDGLTVAAEWARFYGEWLYDYTGSDGSTFKGLYENVRHWTRYPEDYPYNSSPDPSMTVRIMAHDEILHALWPHEESQWLLDNFLTGSVRDNYGMRQFVLAYRDRPLYG